MYEILYIKIRLIIYIKKDGTSLSDGICVRGLEVKALWTKIEEVCHPLGQDGCDMWQGVRNGL